MTPSSISSATGWWGNDGRSWFIALAGAAVGVVVVHLVVWALRRRLLPRAQRSQSTALRAVADALGAVRLRLLVPIAVLVAAGFLTFPPRVAFWIDMAAFALIGLQLVLCVNRLIVTAVRYSFRVDSMHRAPVMLSIVTWSLQFVIWLTFLLAVLAAGGVNITAFVASLGVGGIAVALALQNVLGDLFASISIGLDKPFGPGDYISFDEGEGTVAHIGIKSTRITSITGEELSIANSNLLSRLTHNYNRMAERRVAFGFTVPFTTTARQLEAIVTTASSIIAEAPAARFDRGHFTGFGTDGFTFEFVYYLADSSFVTYRDTHQQIALRVMAAVAEEGVEFAIPARAVTMR